MGTGVSQKGGNDGCGFSLKDREFQLQHVATIPEACGYDPHEAKETMVSSIEL